MRCSPRQISLSAGSRSVAVASLRMWELQLLEGDGAFYQLSGTAGCMMLSKMVSACMTLTLCLRAVGTEKGQPMESWMLEDDLSCCQEEPGP